MPKPGPRFSALSASLSTNWGLTPRGSPGMGVKKEKDRWEWRERKGMRGLRKRGGGGTEVFNKRQSQWLSGKNSVSRTEGRCQGDENRSDTKTGWIARIIGGNMTQKQSRSGCYRITWLSLFFWVQTSMTTKYERGCTHTHSHTLWTVLSMHGQLCIMSKLLLSFPSLSLFQ